MRTEKRRELDALKETLNIKGVVQIPNREIEKMFLQISTHQITLNDGYQMILERLTKGKNIGTNGGDAVAILPVTTNNELVFTVQPRNIGPCVEIPAGYINAGEDPEEAAVRELEEETGLICRKPNLYKLTDYLQDTGIATSRVHVFLGCSCIDTFKQNLDRDEHIKLFRCTIEEGNELYESGELEGASSKLAFATGKSLMKMMDWKVD